MPFARAKLADLVTRIRGDLRGRLAIVGPLLRRALVDVLGAAWGGAIHSVNAYLDWLSRQLFALTAERDQLLRIAAVYGIFPAIPQYAGGFVTITGADGSSVLAGTILRLDEQTAYSVTVGATIASGTATLSVVAAVAGGASNLDAGTALSFESPIAGVNATAIVASGGLAGGDDGDAGDAGTERVRVRLLLRLRQPPAGGRDADYIQWALDVPGVTRAWVFRREFGLGTVVVRFVRDGDAASIFPDAAAVAAVQASLDANRPTTAVATAMAPTSLPVAFTIHVVPDTADTRAAVAAGLADLMGRVAEPGDGVARGKVLLSAIRTAIGSAAGVTDYTLTVPSADVVPGIGQLPTVGDITWV